MFELQDQFYYDVVVGVLCVDICYVGFVFDWWLDFVIVLLGISFDGCFVMVMVWLWGEVGII